MFKNKIIGVWENQKKENLYFGIKGKLINIDYFKFTKKKFNIILIEKFSTIYTWNEYMEIINEITIPFIIRIKLIIMRY